VGDRPGDVVGEITTFGLSVVAITVAGRMAYRRWGESFKMFKL
jgi:hypothetical protein